MAAKAISARVMKALIKRFDKYDDEVLDAVKAGEHWRSIHSPTAQASALKRARKAKAKSVNIVKGVKRRGGWKKMKTGAGVKIPRSLKKDYFGKEILK